MAELDDLAELILRKHNFSDRGGYVRFSLRQAFILGYNTRKKLEAWITGHSAPSDELQNTDPTAEDYLESLPK